MGQKLCLHTKRPASAATEGGRAGCFLPGPKPRVFYTVYHPSTQLLLYAMQVALTYQSYFLVH